MRAFGTFLLFLLGLITGGATGYFIASLRGASKDDLQALQEQVTGLEEELTDTQSLLLGSEMQVEGSLDLLGGYKAQIDRLRQELEEAQRIAQDAQLAANEAAQRIATGNGIAVQQIASTTDEELRVELNNAYNQIRALQAQLQSAAAASGGNSGSVSPQVQELQRRVQQLAAERDSLLNQLQTAGTQVVNTLQQVGNLAGEDAAAALESVLGGAN